MPKEVFIEAYGEAADSADTAPNKAMIMSVDDARSIAQGYIEDMKRSQSYHEDNRSAREALTDLVFELVSQEKQLGGPNSFHNFAVTLGSINDDLACEVLDCGLQRSPMHVDMLADYLIYGIDCDRFDRCRECFDTLCTIEKTEWTWRCYAFSIAYLSRLKTRCKAAEERAALKKQINSLARDYRKHLPNYEGGYREMAKLLSNTPEKELKALTDAMNDPKIYSCAAIAFRCADIYFSQQKYHEALEAIKRCRMDSISQTQGGINKHYLYMLSALSKTAIAMIEGTTLTRAEVLDIYSDFDIALQKLHDESYLNTIKEEAGILQSGTHVEITDDTARLLDLVGVY